MDWVKISELLVAYLAPLVPYLIKYGEGIASEFGKETAHKIGEVASDAWSTLKSLIPNMEQSGLSRLSNSEDSIIRTRAELARTLEHVSQNNPENAEKLSGIINQIRVVVYDTIVDGFLMQDIQELYLRMGVGFDDIVMGANPGIRALVFSLLDYSNRRDGGISKLINTVAKTRPDLNAKLIVKTDQGNAKNELENIGVLLAEKLTLTDLNEIYFRLGVGTDELIRRAKARAIIEYAETRFVLPELVRNMWVVNPSLIKKS